MDADHAPRLFADDAAIRRVGEQFVARTLPKAEWTHEAHLATCLWLILERPDIDPDSSLGAMIARYNESVGGVNDDAQGYHETITRAYLAAVRAFAATSSGGLAERVNALLLSPFGARGWPLTHWSRELLFSVAARRGWVEPDLAPLPTLAAPTTV